MLFHIIFRVDILRGIVAVLVLLTVVFLNLEVLHRHLHTPDHIQVPAFSLLIPSQIIGSHSLTEVLHMLLTTRAMCLLYWTSLVRPPDPLFQTNTPLWKGTVAVVVMTTCQTPEQVNLLSVLHTARHLR